MNTVTPIPIFIPPPEPEKCPHCKRVLSVKMTCRECGGEIEEDESEPLGFWGIVTIIGIILFAVWLVGTLMYWLLDWEDSSLIEVLKYQLEWLKSKRIW